jgi:nucleobase:cation symporter-1, NCS1 family
MTGIVIADYFVVHRRELHLDDLYIGNHTSAYWYTAGFNWRAPVAWYADFPPPLPLSPLSAISFEQLGRRHPLCADFPACRAMGVWPMLPGFVRQTRGISGYSGWDNLFRINFFAGLGIAFVIHAVLHGISPATGGKGSSTFGERKQGLLADRTTLNEEACWVYEICYPLLIIQPILYQ